jgi:hypothetical protein
MGCHLCERLLREYIEATGEFSEATGLLSGLTGEPRFTEYFEIADQARAKCSSALDAMYRHRADHRREDPVSTAEAPGSINLRGALT